MENKIQMQKNDELQKYQFYSQIHLCIFYRKINFSLIFTFLLKKRERIKKNSANLNLLQSLCLQFAKIIRVVFVLEGR